MNESSNNNKKKPLASLCHTFPSGVIIFSFFSTLICHFTPNRIEIVLSFYHIFFIEKFFFLKLSHSNAFCTAMYIVPIFSVSLFFPRCRLEHLKMDTLKLLDHCYRPYFFFGSLKSSFFDLQITNDGWSILQNEKQLRESKERIINRKKKRKKSRSRWMACTKRCISTSFHEF